jgi:hypothetical protein
LFGIRFNGDSCEHGTGLSASIKDVKFLDHQGRYVRLGGNSIARCLDMQDTGVASTHSLYATSINNALKCEFTAKVAWGIIKSVSFNFGCQQIETWDCNGVD